MPSTRAGIALLLLLVSSAGVSGCYAKATAYNGSFTFAYQSGVDVDNFVKPIAPGAKLDVVIFANGTEDELTITKATSSKRNVVQVDSFDRKTITLRGVAPGVAEIEVTAQDPSGKALVDRMFFHVASPSRHGLEHSCSEEKNAAYVKGEDIYIWHSLATGDRRHVIGYDYAPLSITPSSALSLTRQPQGSGVYVFKAPAAQESVTLRSKIDDGQLTLRVVDRASLTNATLRAPEKMIEGSSAYAVAWVNLPGTTLCSQTALTRARSLTPETCRVTAKLDEDPEDSNREQLVKITAVKFGECKYEVTLPELDQGRGVVLAGKTSIGRVEYPKSGREADAPPPSSSLCASRWLEGAWPRKLLDVQSIISRVILLGAIALWSRRQRDRSV